MDLSNFCSEIKKKSSNSIKFIDDARLSVDLDGISSISINSDLKKYLPWFLKYQLKSYKDLIKTKEIEFIQKFLLQKEFKKGILLYGTPGSGKTTTLTLIANYLDYEVFEMNASDTRNKKSINGIISDILTNYSLFQKKRLILVDEVDGISGIKDRGGVSAIVKLMKENSSVPFCFTANIIDVPALKPLLRYVEKINFESHSKELLFKIGKRILDSEKISFSENVLKEFIEERNLSDIRSFINDLQGSVINGKFLFKKDLYIRNYKQKIDSLIQSILLNDPDLVLEEYFESDVNIDDLLLYLEENVPSFFSDESLAYIFNNISKADLFKGRIMRWQYWRFLVYVSFYLTYGVSSYKLIFGDKVSSSVDFNKIPIKKNSRILKKWIYENKFSILKERTKIQKDKGQEESFIERIAHAYGCSVKKFKKESLESFLFIFKSDYLFRKKIIESFELSDSEVEKILSL